MDAIVYTNHVMLKMRQRGIVEAEVEQTIETGTLVDQSGTLYIRRRVFTGGYRWYERDYPQKEVTVVYVIENDSITALTAIARYGRFEEA